MNSEKNTFLVELRKQSLQHVLTEDLLLHIKEPPRSCLFASLTVTLLLLPFVVSVLIA